MKFTLITIGKTTERYIQTGLDDYLKRVNKYISFKVQEIKQRKQKTGLSSEITKQEEGKLILKNIQDTDFLILLDEKGKDYTSTEFSTFLQEKMINTRNNIVFVIGGAYGFSSEMYERADKKISLSRMTFSHQLVRLIFIEQLYRALTIWKGEPYHHG